jgi:hypothetical protein
MTIGSVGITIDLNGIDRLLGEIGKQNTVTTTQNPIQNSVSVAVADPTATTTIAGVEASDAASITVYGRTGRQLVTILANQTQAQSLAEYLVRPAPEYWFSSIEVLLNGLSDGDRDTVAELEIGDQIAVSKRFPNVANPVVQELFVEGVQHDISVDRHVVRLYCSPASLYELFRLNGFITTLTRTNLVTNPSFETNTANWVGIASGVGTRITTDSKFGSACMSVAKAGVANSGVRTDRPAASPGVVYRASGYLKIPTGQEAGTLRFQLRMLNAAVNAVLASAQQDIAITPGADWVRFTTTVTAPANTAFLDVQVFQPAAGTAGQTFLVDAVLVEQTADLRPYFDGGTADTWTGYTNLTTAWTGTTNNSTSTSLWGVGSTPDSVLDSPAVGLG